MDKNLIDELNGKGLQLDQLQYFFIEEKVDNYKKEAQEEILIKFGDDVKKSVVSYMFSTDNFGPIVYNYIKELAQVDFKINFNSDEYKNFTKLNFCDKNGKLLEQLQFYHDEEFINELENDIIKK